MKGNLINKMSNRRCVIVGGASISDYNRIRGYLREDDFVIYCDSGLRHLEGLGSMPSLIVGDFDSHEDPHMDVETITLPVAKDDTDTVYAAREGKKRGFTDFLLVGVFGARLDHTLVNAFILFDLDTCGFTAMAVDDYSEIEVISPRRGTVYIADRYPFFSLVNMTGIAKGITIRNAKFPVEDVEIMSDYQYATSNEVTPGQMAEVSIREGRLLLIRDI